MTILTLPKEPLADYEKFKNDFILAVKQNLGEKNIKVNNVVKNGVKVDQIVYVGAKEKPMQICPSLTINDIYQRFNEIGMLATINEAVNGLENAAEKAEEQNEFVEKLMSGNVKSNIFPVLRNQNIDKEFLNSAPHKNVLDLTYMFYIVENPDNKDFGYRTVVTNELMQKILKINEEELFEIAFKNLKEKKRPILNEMGAGDCNMLILSSENYHEGSVYMFDTECLESISKGIEDDLFILPSSIHEVIIMPYNQGLSAEKYKEIIKDTNETTVAETEKLSDNLYFYNRKNNKIEIEK